MDNLNLLRSQVAKALGHPIRLALINLLDPEEEKCVCQLVEELGCGQPVVSKHLSVLKNTGLIASRKEGLKTLYRLRAPCIKEFLACIDRVLKQDLEQKKRELASLG
ncbi:MAG: metalloregulator ArsR/SmtB family transcription factor [Bacillota bacterium]|nr:metalloregulator ArsR/SmtB family transcription factor [Bacillota bacterium]